MTQTHHGRGTPIQNMRLRRGARNDQRKSKQEARKAEIRKTNHNVQNFWKRGLGKKTYDLKNII